MKRRRCVSIGLFIAVFLSGAKPVYTMAFENASVTHESQNQLSVKVSKVHEKYGNVYIGIKNPDFLKLFQYGDIVDVSIGGQFLEVPVCSSYSDVDSKKAVIVASSAEDKVNEDIILAINLGSFADTYGTAVNDNVTIALSKKGGYLDEYEIRQLKRTNNRDDYSSDEVFANFREVTYGSIAPGRLYRSSNPINPEIGRNQYAMRLTEAAGVKVIFNLSETAEEVTAHLGTDTNGNLAYYKGLNDTGNVYAMGMGLDSQSEDFKQKLAVILREMSEKKGPYLIHCVEGKDRTGFVAALLEALMGAKYWEIKDDYMDSFVNFFHVPVAPGQYDRIGNNNILESMRQIAGIPKGGSLKGVDLSKAAENYIKSIGLTDDEIERIKVNLSN
ncbi:tyrosine-protein phosphatase [Lacrimispora sp.]|uniref:tyrosine-protein phosphatase n=1 Tax=Lacrimispora sp. TaxID=2719234 RepID=UPI0028B03684|nr:tyrosine-protein phosphatase [Lacrimispora sp.]